MITPHIELSSFFPAEAADDLFVAQQRKVKIASIRLKQCNMTINIMRAQVEHVFAGLSPYAGKCGRAMTLTRNTRAITLQCAAYNARRLVWLIKSAGASARPA